MNAREHTNHLAALFRKETSAMADFLRELSEFDRQRRWAELGHTSLFYFLARELHLSAGAAQARATAVRLIQEVPEVEAALREGQLCLTTINELAKVLTPENREEILPRFFGLSRKTAAVLAASLQPAAVIPVRDVVTPVRTAPRAVAAAVEPASPSAPIPEPVSVPFRPGEVPAPAQFRLGEVPAPPVVAAPEPASPPAPVPLRDFDEPLDAEQARLHVTVSRALLEKLEAAKNALAHAMPGATTSDILERGLDLILAESEKRKGVVEKPLKEPRPCSGGTIPAHVRREVWRRSGGCCEFVLESGERCGSRYMLEFDHIVAAALGGKATVDNIRVACRPHNLAHARAVFGDAVMDRYTRKRPPPRTEAPSTLPFVRSQAP